MLRRAGLLVAGIVLLQCVLFGSSLCGSTVLAPTDLLLASGWLGAAGDNQPANELLSDPVLVFLPWLDFAAGEVRAGRVPLWNPYAFCGSPFLANNQSGVFSPFHLPYYLWPAARTLAWIQLLKAIVAGTGTYVFLRGRERPAWIAVLGAWAWPLSGFLVAWLSFPLSATAVWLPWIFWGVDAVVRRPGSGCAIALAAIVGLTLCSGHLETAAHILIAAATYAVWRLVQAARGPAWRTAALARIALGCAAGVLGIGLAAAQILPTAEYLQYSQRIALRESRQIEQQLPSGALPELVRMAFPYCFGTWQAGSHELVRTPFNEGGPNGYVGFVFVLLAAWRVAHGVRQAETWWWVVLGLLAAAPMFQVPLLGAWGQWGPFQIMNNRRMLLVTGWCVLVLGLDGLQAVTSPLEHSAVTNRGRWRLAWAHALVLVAILAGLVAATCVAIHPPARLLHATTLEAWPWFRRHLAHAAITCGGLALGFATCLVMRLSRPVRLADPASERRFVSGTGDSGSEVQLDHCQSRSAGRVTWTARGLIGLTALVELVLSASGYNPQPAPDTFYPPSELTVFLSQRAGEWRTCGMGGVLPPNLAMRYGLSDLRGYDAVDPLPYLELLAAANPAWQLHPPYGVTLRFWSGPSPILDLLGGRYLVTAQRIRGSWRTLGRVAGLWVYENPAALPRAFIPRRTISAPAASDRLRQLAQPSFNPRELALISEAVELPETPATGSVSILHEIPSRVELLVQAQSDCVVVLADSWAPGWQVQVDGAPADALQADHALRAVRVAEGEHRVVWTYEPESYRHGLRITRLTAMCLVLWTVGRGGRRLAKRRRVATTADQRTQQ